MIKWNPCTKEKYLLQLTQVNFKLNKGNDCHDVTLRMYNALIKESTVVFSHNPHHTNMLLKALSQKDRHVDPSFHKSSEN